MSISGCSSSPSFRSTPQAKNSLTFENVVCSQIELQRRAAAFSRRRSTSCRRSSHFVVPMPMVTSLSSRNSIFSNHFDVRTSISNPNVFPADSTRRHASLVLTPDKSDTDQPMPNNSTGERQSLLSIFYWEANPKNAIRKDETRQSKWSLDFQKETPQYGSLRSRLIEEYGDCESLLEFVKKTILVLIKTRATTIFLCFLLILPIIMIGIGVSHLNDCPRQPKLPIYLFVAGIVWTTKLLQNIWQKYRLDQKYRNDEETSSDHNDGHMFVDGLMTSFLIVWFFLGHYWLISIGYPPNYEQPLEAPEIWCQKSVVLGVFASIVITYLILIFFIGLVILLVIVTRFSVIRRTTTT